MVSKPVHRKTFAEVAEAVSTVVDSSADFLDLVTDTPIVKNEVAEKKTRRFT